MHRRDVLRGAAVIAGAWTAGCVGADGTENETAPTVRGETLRLATTTSTYATGLLGELNETFEERYGIEVDAVPQGTGAALATGRNGDADVVVVHARVQEDEFIRNGYGTNRRDLMYNDFILVGPADDPADIGHQSTVIAAFETIVETESMFISRGDNSGTHYRETEIWEAVGIEPGGEWYRSIGSGMGQTLSHAHMAGGAYTLTDRGTYLSMRSKLDLKIVFAGPVAGEPALLANPYGILAVDPATHPHVAYDLAMAYIGYLTSPEGQEQIATYTVDGEQLFIPSALEGAPNIDQFVPEDWEPKED